MKFFTGFLFASCCFWGLACKNTPSDNKAQLPQQASEIMLTDARLPADFVEFYRRFHSDSLYQIEHINWPLAGKQARQIDSGHVDLEEVRWQPETWRMQHAVDFSTGEFVQEFEPLGDVMVIERIRTPGREFSLERRFAKGASEEWSLIYYRDMYESN